MSPVNEHIEHYLKYYFDLEFSPGFAVLLQGEWGCGKTWFIKNFRERYEENCPQDYKKRLLYISLYGVTAISDIEVQLFQQLYPKLSSKSVTLTGKILQQFMWKPLAEVGKELSDELFNFLKVPSRGILIFDDLERCHLPVEETLGYINAFVEHHEFKAVILANEEKLQRTDTKSDDNVENEDGSEEREKEIIVTKYEEIKEKLIGKTFRVEHDVDAAFDSFVEHIADNRVKDFLCERKPRIIEIFATADYKNLRHLKQSLWDFGRFYLEIPERYRSISGLIDNLLAFFLAFSFDIKAAKILPSDIQKIGKVWLQEALAKQKNEKPKPLPIHHTIRTYPFINPDDLVINPSAFILSEEYWCELFDRGSLAQEKLIESLQNSEYCQDENTPAWRKLCAYPRLEDDEFFNLLEQVQAQWNSQEFTRPGEILHVAGIFLRLSQIGLYRRDIEVVLQDCKDYIDRRKESGIWRNFKRQRHHTLLEKEHWGGVAYTGNNMEEFDELYTYLYTKIEESALENMPQAARDLLLVLHENPEQFGRMVTLSNSHDQIYFEVPILNHVDPSDFFWAWLNVKNQKKWTIGHALRERYQFPEIAIKLASEMLFLEGIDKLLKERSEEEKGTLTGYILGELRQQFIQVAITQLSNSHNQEQS